jgi:hypothetical protein
MKPEIQKEIFPIYGWEDYIIPGYGVCSHGIASYKGKPTSYGYFLGP